MTGNTYELDTLIQVQTTFTLEDGVTPVDPTGVIVYVRTPDGVVAAYTYGVDPAVMQLGVGNYALDLTTSQSGPWVYKWQGTGVVEITSPDVYFTVNQSADLMG